MLAHAQSHAQDHAARGERVAGNPIDELHGARLSAAARRACRRHLLSDCAGADLGWGCRPRRRPCIRARPMARRPNRRARAQDPPEPGRNRSGQAPPAPEYLQPASSQPPVPTFRDHALGLADSGRLRKSEGSNATLNAMSEFAGQSRRCRRNYSLAGLSRCRAANVGKNTGVLSTRRVAVPRLFGRPSGWRAWRSSNWPGSRRPTCAPSWRRGAVTVWAIAR